MEAFDHLPLASVIEDNGVNYNKNYKKLKIN